jgi:DNA repair protein RadC
MPRKLIPVRDASDVYRIFKDLGRLKHERVYSLLLDGEGNVIQKEEVAKGCAYGVEALPDVLFGSAWLKECSSLIIVHNHPSGIPSPSSDDFKVTKNLRSAGRRRGVNISDSVIVAAGGYYSFREAGLLEELYAKEQP